jgi:hypothetical protein
MADESKLASAAPAAATQIFIAIKMQWAYKPKDASAYALGAFRAWDDALAAVLKDWAPELDDSDESAEAADKAAGAEPEDKEQGERASKKAKSEKEEAGTPAKANARARAPLSAMTEPELDDFLTKRGASIYECTPGGNVVFWATKEVYYLVDPVDFASGAH